MKHCLAAALFCSCIAVTTLASAGERLHFVERPLHEVTTHIHSGQDSPGDLLTFANPVFNAANRVQVASDHGFCIRVVSGKSWECFWTLITRDGLITVEGPFMDSGDSRLTITGGTGKYAGAKGEMILHPRSHPTTAYDFIYELR